jgi:AcrR family transcriptional regulator
MPAPEEFQRARRPEHKQQRRDAILDAARTLARDRRVQHISLGDVAAAAGMAKSNVLRYFETREEIYLQLTLEAFEEWTGLLAGRLLADPPGGPLQLADAIAGTLSERPVLCDLFAQMSATLEHNVSPAAVLDFKTAITARTLQAAEVISAAFPAVTVEQAMDLAGATYVVVAGLWPASNPPPEVARLLEEAGLHHARMDFDTILRRLLRAIIVGLPAAGPL